MSIHVKTKNFEGPFDLLLDLVSRHKIDICSIAISDIADQYLSYVSDIVILDIETASDFMSVAATLVDIKAKSLLPSEVNFAGDDVSKLSPNEAREILISRLIRYKQFKNAAIWLREELEGSNKGFRRTAGLTSDFDSMEPDYLKNTNTNKLAHLALERLGRRDQFLLASNHIASKPINVEIYVEVIFSRCKERGRVVFSELVKECPKKEIVVVTLLAVLELYKRNRVNINQIDEFGDIEITPIDVRETYE